MLTAAQSKDVSGLLQAAIVAALDDDAWLQTTGTVYESGDASAQLSGWSLTGASASNSNDGLLYWNLSNVASTRTVYVYKAAAKASGDLVAQGSSVGDGAVTLTQRNTSGLSGAVTVAYTTDDTDSGNTLSFGLGGIRWIMEKYAPLDELTTWTARRPMLAVLATPGEQSAGAFGAYEQRMECAIEYRDVYGDTATGAAKLQEVIDRLMRWVKDECWGGGRFNGFLDSGDGWVVSGPTPDIQSIPVGNEDAIAGFARAASVLFTVNLTVIV